MNSKKIPFKFENCASCRVGTPFVGVGEVAANILCDCCDGKNNFEQLTDYDFEVIAKKVAE